MSRVLMFLILSFVFLGANTTALAGELVYEGNVSIECRWGRGFPGGGGESWSRHTCVRRVEVSEPGEQTIHCRGMRYFDTVRAPACFDTSLLCNHYFRHTTCDDD